MRISVYHPGREFPMRSRIAMHGAALGALLAACTSAPQTPVPIVAAAPEVRALAGQWEGSYSSAATGRSGSISFTLTASGDSPAGDVIMIPRGWGRPLRAWDRTERGAATEAQQSSQVLNINFVRVAGGRVNGTLAPYADPQTGAKLFTRFDGRLDRDTIEGTYSTTVAGSATSQTGQWPPPPRDRTGRPTGNPPQTRSHARVRSPAAAGE